MLIIKWAALWRSEIPWVGIVQDTNHQKIVHLWWKQRCQRGPGFLREMCDLLGLRSSASSLWLGDPWLSFTSQGILTLVGSVLQRRAQQITSAILTKEGVCLPNISSPQNSYRPKLDFTGAAVYPGLKDISAEGVVKWLGSRQRAANGSWDEFVDSWKKEDWVYWLGTCPSSSFSHVDQDRWPFRDQRQL